MERQLQIQSTMTTEDIAPERSLCEQSLWQRFVVLRDFCLQVHSTEIYLHLGRHNLYPMMNFKERIGSGNGAAERHRLTLFELIHAS